MEPSLSQRRKSLVAVLERNISQPSCGCNVAWQWGYMTATDVLPGMLRIARITPCKQHQADGGLKSGSRASTTSGFGPGGRRPG